MRRKQGARLRRAGVVAVGFAHGEGARVVGARGLALAAERGSAAERQEVERDLARRADLAVDGQGLLQLRARVRRIAISG